MDRDTGQAQGNGERCPLASIVVPSYNHADYIPACLESIFEQDYPRIELIVINDGSTDGTDGVIRDILKKNPSRFRYISKDNEGLIKTLNLGLRTASGDYLCELASDDMLLPGSISRRISWLEEHPDIDAVFADGYLVKGNEKTRERVNEGKPRYSSSGHELGELIEGKARIFFPSGMFRKRVLDSLGGFDEDFRYFEDLAMQLPLALSARIGYLDEPVLYYRRHGSNISAVQKVWVRKEKILALEKLLGTAGNSLRTIARRQLYREYLKLLHYASGNKVGKEELMETYRKARAASTFAFKARYHMMRLRLKGYL